MPQIQQLCIDVFHKKTLLVTQQFLAIERAISLDKNGPESRTRCLSINLGGLGSYGSLHYG